MQANEQVLVIQKYIAAYNAFDVDGMLKLLSPDVRFENWSGAHLNTEASGAWWRKGMAYEQLGDKAKARASYMQSLALDPAFDKAKQALAKLDTPKT